MVVPDSGLRSPQSDCPPIQVSNITCEMIHGYIDYIVTARYFDRDPETNEVLWFAAPPLDIAHPPGPEYSLEYLAFLARKRKDAKAGSVSGEDGPR